MDDTPPHITEKLCELLHQKTPTERYVMGWSMYETSRYLIINAIMEENPQFTEADLKKELFLRFYGDDFSEEEKEKIFIHIEKHSSKQRAHTSRV